jgi:hypothetical protein
MDLNMRNVTAAAQVMAAAEGNRRVRRLVDDRVVEGVARSIGDQQGYFVRGDAPLEELYLRVTGSTGFDYYWPLPELMQQVLCGEFAVDHG